MAAVAAVLGLVAGIVLGLSSLGSPPRASAAAPTETTAAATTTTLPDAFDTVVLGSYNERPFADARLRQVRRQGARDAAMLDREDYILGPGGPCTAASSGAGSRPRRTARSSPRWGSPRASGSM
jgi:hypothetical protein